MVELSLSTKVLDEALQEEAKVESIPDKKPSWGLSSLFKSWKKNEPKEMSS